MYDRMPSFRGIEAFLIVVEAGGIRAASRHMNLTVSAVSHRIRTLEAEVGVPLFLRGTRALTLTAAAHKFYEELRPIVQSIHAATAHLATQAKAPTLSVSAANIIFAYWLTSRLGSWRERMPNVSLDIHTIGGDNSSDSAITIRCHYDEKPRPDEIRLFGWEVAPICRPELIEKIGLYEPADLARVALLDVSRPQGGWECWLKAAGLPGDLGKHELVLDSYELLLESASHGLGVAMGAVSMMSDYRDRGLVAPFALTCSLPGGVYVNGPAPGENPLAGLFREWVIEEARSDFDCQRSVATPLYN